MSREADRDGREGIWNPYSMEHFTPSIEGTGGLGSVVAPSPGHDTTDVFDGASSTQPAAAVFSSTAAAQGLPTEQVARGDAEASQTLAAGPRSATTLGCGGSGAPVVDGSDAAAGADACAATVDQSMQQGGAGGGQQSRSGAADAGSLAPAP